MALSCRRWRRACVSAGGRDRREHNATGRRRSQRYGRQQVVTGASPKSISHGPSLQPLCFLKVASAHDRIPTHLPTYRRCSYSSAVLLNLTRETIAQTHPRHIHFLSLLHVLPSNFLLHCFGILHIRQPQFYWITDSRTHPHLVETQNTYPLDTKII